MKVSYFNIQRFCLHDGPGIRTTLFMKGCPLRCLWCHNPEGQSPSKELFFRRDKCVFCGKCLGLCEARSASDGKISVDRALCTACGKCASVCIPDCNEICGKESEVEDLFETLIRDRLYFENSDGGITVSGGEPLSQKEALVRLAKLSRDANISFAVETSGYGDASALSRLASLGSLFLYDLKGADDEKHIANTGVSNKTIISNLDMLAGAGADIILRLPLVPGYNDSGRDLRAISALISKYKGKVRHAEIMPYHRIGLGKIPSLGREAGDENIPDGREFCDRWKAVLEDSGVDIIVN